MNKLRYYIGKLLQPISHELPFFVVFTILTSLPGIILFCIHHQDVPLSILIQRVFTLLCMPLFWAYLFSFILYQTESILLRIFLYGIVLLLLTVNLFLIWQFGTMLSPWIFLLLFETNSREALEFIHRYIGSTAFLYTCLTLVFVCVLIVLAEKRKHSVRCKNWLLIGSAPFHIIGCYLTILLLFSLTIRDQYHLETWYGGHGQYSTMNTLGNLIYSIHHLRIAGKENEIAVRNSINASKKHLEYAGEDSLNVILIIGESYNKYHASIYGYALPTTPHLEKEQNMGNLCVFTDAVSPYNITSLAMKNMISTNSISKGEAWYEKPAFPIIFKNAGFRVLFWDNQKPSADTSFYDFSLGSYLYNPQTISLTYSQYNHTTYPYDHLLFQSFVREAKMDKLNLCIFHLMGQHSAAGMRFPHEKRYRQFHLQDIKRSDLNEQERQDIADYDNATYYNDQVIASVIDYFRSQNSVIVYLSDHGEEVYDYRHFIGRTLEQNKSQNAVKYQYDIPMVIWFSEQYKKNHPDIVNAVRHAATLHFESDNIPLLLFSLAQI